MPENVEVAPAPTAEAQQDVAQANDAKAEANSTAKASDELSEDDLEGVAGGAYSYSADMRPSMQIREVRGLSIDDR